MRKVHFIFSFILLLFIACDTSKSESSSGSNVEKLMSSGKFQCPMKCEGEKSYDSAGACPDCRMELKKIK
ncbi:MAG: hypothetical protein EXR20_07515 [Bacteroidetes bacterium]|nr:hypothetical protein [Bacteroidota bacterium]PHX83165.1 MAG: hypothetical protein CK539_01245 [Flavobacteriales bacterium]